MKPNEILIDTDVDIAPEWEQCITDVCNAVLAHEDFPYPAEISVLITDAQTIQNLNSTYRGIDAPTDVLSFAMDEDVEEEDGDDETQSDAPDAELDTEEMDEDDDSVPYPLGDIVICAEVAKRQAEEYGHSILREVGFLTAHGMLHLLGYDHSEDDREATDGNKCEMFKIQDEILNRMGLKRNGLEK